ncbi:MAG TPA: hypothetical protein VM901_05635 [Bdellovibrionota bacterium]|jgi:hypothetical protein|nr:hypothetical protein [Bdellovibrionota bacterium]
MKLIKSLVALATLASVAAQANPQGISFAIPNGGGATVGTVFNRQADRELRVDIGLSLAKAGENADTVFGTSAEVGFRRYLAEAGKVKMYHQPGGFVSIKDFGEFSETLTLAALYSIGGEYVVTPNFTFGASIGLIFSLSEEFKAFALKTGTSKVNATYYF